MASETLLDVHGLKTHFKTDDGIVRAVDGVDLAVGRGETLSVVGESGSGKTVTAMSVLKLIPMPPGKIIAGEILWKGRDLVPLNTDEMRHIRSREIAIVFQEPMTSLNPVYTVGEQIAESIRLHQGKSHAAARLEALSMLEQVRIPEAKQVLDRHPHQLSGGMRQRVMIAMALSCRPALLIADEPTTALDVTIQAQILGLIRALQDQMHMAVIFITHDMGVVAEVAERVIVMYQGANVEDGPVETIFHAPQHTYTKALLAAVPKLGSMQGTDAPARFPLLAAHGIDTPPVVVEALAAPQGPPLLKVHALKTRFDLASGFFGRVRRQVHAVEQVSFDRKAGETPALVGAYGCGKSTTGRS